MACTTDIAKVIVSDCSTLGRGGIEIKVWIANRKNIASITYDVTNPTKVTAMTMVTGKRFWTITGYKKNLNAGFDFVGSDDLPKKWSHYFSLKGYEYDAASVENFDSLEDVVVIYESKDKGTGADGVFRILGLKYGLYTSTDTMRANENSGSRNIELASLAGQEESHSQYTFDSGDYAATLADIVELETPAT